MQARIDSKVEKIVGINSFRLEKEDPLEILEVDNTAVRQAQIERLEKLRAIRDPEKVEKTLSAITHAMESGEGNLLELAVDAALTISASWPKRPTSVLSHRIASENRAFLSENGASTMTRTM